VRAKEKFPGVYVINNRLATRNLAPGKRVYGENLRTIDGVEYRIWNPRRSKLAAALYRGLRNFPVGRKSKILYLGAASGTTASHFSDIAPEGLVFSVEFSPRSFLKLMYLCRERRNMIPLLCDARRPESYQSLMEKCDLIYQDLAQPLQGEILISNSHFYLRERGHVMLMVKARSIDVRKPPRRLYSREAGKLKKDGFKVLEILELSPYEKDHALILARSRGH
jgi:fibrillarin-like pre-rRNA processing protein